jgi:hypothetical protein
MKRVAVLVAAVLCAAAPASVGLIGNASFSEDVPVRVPETAIVLDRTGGTPTPTPSGDRSGRGSDDSGAPEVPDTPRASPTAAPSTEDGPHHRRHRAGGGTEPGDDHGGDRAGGGGGGSGDDDGGGGGDGGGDRGGDGGGDRSGSDGGSGSGSGGSGSGGRQSGHDG